jgi:DNA-binding response OmpR family regulator
MSDLGDPADRIRVDDLEITPDEGLVRAKDQVLTLSVREFQLLLALVQRAGGIVSRDELCRAVWGRELRSGDRSVDVYVSKLRAKLERAVPERRYIHTHPSFGYRFQSQARLSRDLDGGDRRTAQAGQRAGGRQRTAGQLPR